MYKSVTSSIDSPTLRSRITMMQKLVRRVLTAAQVLWICMSVHSADVPTVALNNGIRMPAMLWGSGGPTQENATSTQAAVKLALQAGFPGIGILSTLPLFMIYSFILTTTTELTARCKFDACILNEIPLVSNSNGTYVSLYPHNRFV